jgi:hypothetical protein
LGHQITRETDEIRMAQNQQPGNGEKIPFIVQLFLPVCPRSFTGMRLPLLRLNHTVSDTHPTTAVAWIYCASRIGRSMQPLERVWINGGRQGFLVEISPEVLRQILAPREVNVAIVGEPG